MSVRSPQEYLSIEVHTAPPQRLQLMLIDGAIRNVQLAKQFWSERQDEAAGERIIRAQEIVSQLLAGLSLPSQDELIRRIAAVYNFLIRSLMQAHVQRDRKKLDDVLRVLEIERGTWQEVCQQLGSQKSIAGASGPHFSAQSSGEIHTGPLSLEA